MTHTQEPGRLLVAEDLYGIPDDGFHRYELVDGVLRVSEPPFPWHGTLQTRMAAVLHAFVSERKLGVVMTESGFVVRRGPDTVRGPDVAFIRAERFATEDAKYRFVEGAPDLVVEIVSDGDTRKEIADKVRGYLAGGARLVWVVYPRRKSVIVHAADDVVSPLWEDETLDGGDVLQGFQLPLAELFADP